MSTQTKTLALDSTLQRIADKLETVEVMAGPKGDKGEIGLQGAPGRSAYEVAQMNGYRGTVTEWLDSLQGASANMTINGHSITEETSLNLLETNDLPNTFRTIGGESVLQAIDRTEDIPLKTINGQSIIGEGDIQVAAGTGSGNLTNYYTKSEVDNRIDGVYYDMLPKSQLKLINGQSLIGSGSLVISGNTYDMSDYVMINEFDTRLFGHLKTINGQSLVGDGNITISGGSGSGTYPTAGSFNSLVSNTIETGTGTDSYFQTQRMRGEGNADTYYHAVDWGYSGHNQVDFYEYGGVYNFWKNTGGTLGYETIVLGINEGYLQTANGNMSWPSEGGTLATQEWVTANFSGSGSGSGEGCSCPDYSGDISNLQADVSVLTNDVQNTLVDISDLQSNVSDYGNRLDTLEQNVPTDYSSDIQTLQDNMTTVQGDISTLQGDVSDHGNRIAALESNTPTDYSGDIQTLQDNMTTVQGDVSTLQNDMTTVQGDIVGIQESINNYSTITLVATFEDGSTQNITVLTNG